MMVPYRAALLGLLVNAACLFAAAQPAPPAVTRAPHGSDTLLAIPADDTACASLQKQGAQYAAQANYSAAAATLERGPSACSNSRPILLALARAQMLAQNFSAALASVDLLLRNAPTDTEALITQGQIDYFSQRDAEAESSLKEAIRIAPADAQPHYWLGRIYYMDSRLDEASAEFQKALRLNPEAVRAYDGLALCYESRGDVAATVDTFMKGIELAYRSYPSYDVIYADFAEFVLKYGKGEKALRLAAEAANRNPHESRNFFLAGRAAEELGEYDVSLQWLTRAAELDPNYRDPHYLLARIYRRLGNQQAAAKESDTCRTLSASVSVVRR